MINSLVLRFHKMSLFLNISRQESLTKLNVNFACRVPVIAKLRIRWFTLKAFFDIRRRCLSPLSKTKWFHVGIVERHFVSWRVKAPDWTQLPTLGSWINPTRETQLSFFWKIGLLCKKLTGSDFQEKVEWIEEPVDRWRFCFIFCLKRWGWKN